tara:strand:+ start:8629 stop:10221 length:1593 start_codon:yes stop_codon:yes gene_type:complete
MASIITDIHNCTESAGSTYSTAGVPLTTATVFTKTFTAISGRVFKTAPSINFSEVEDSNSYNVVITDTGSIAGGNLTVRSFAVQYKYPLKLVTNDTINFSAKAVLNIALSTSKIYSFYIPTATVLKQGETREIKVYGDEGAVFTFDVKNASNTSIRGGASNVTIPSTGVYLEDIVFPATTATTTYSVILTEVNNSFLTMSSPQTVSLSQYAVTTITFSMTESASDFIITASNRTSAGDFSRASSTDVELQQVASSGTYTGWSITSQSSTITLKDNGDLNANDWTGTTSGSTNTLTGGSTVRFDNLERTIYPTASHPTNTGTFSAASVTLNGDFRASVKSGMRVTGSGITRSGNTPLLVTDVSYPGTNQTVVTFNQTVGGTVNAATTLTFHSVMHVAGQIGVTNFGASNQTCTLDAADIVAFNQAPTANSQANVPATRSVAKEITLTASDPEGDTLTFILTKTPSNGSLTYTDTNNQAQTITADGGSVSLTLGSPVVLYTASSTGSTTLTFKANDGQQDSGTGTITINVTA